MAFNAANELLGGVLVVAHIGLLGELVVGGSVRVDGYGFEGMGGVFESCFEVGVVETFCRYRWIGSTMPTMSCLCLLSRSWNWTMSRR